MPDYNLAEIDGKLSYKTNVSLPKFVKSGCYAIMISGKYESAVGMLLQYQ
jgi:hypothetical protein